MKKLFSFLAACLCVTSMWGANETFAFSSSSNGITIVQAGAGEPGGNVEATKGVVTVTSAGGQAQANKALQIYKTKSMTVSVPATYNITSIEFNYATSCYPFSEAIPSGLSNATTKTASGKTNVTYNLSTPSNSVTFTNIAGGQTKVNSMIVTYEASGATGVNVTGVALDQTSVAIVVGENTTLAATVAPSNATIKTVTWSSSDEEVATVANGVVTGVAAGTATITVTTTDGNFTATCEVTVTAIAATGVTLNQTSASIEVGEDVTLVATVAPANAANKNVTWTSSDEAVATVENGVVSAVAPGTATITATTEDGGFTATCAVTVNEFVEPNEIEIVFAANSTNQDNSSPWKTSSNISDVFSSGTRYVSSITDVDKVYAARNSLEDGAKFGSSSVAGTITIALAKTFNVSKIVVTAAPYGDTEGQDGFTLNDIDVAMTDGENKVYADYDVNITGAVSEITLTQKVGRIYVKSITLVKATEETSDDITISEAGYATYFNADHAYTMPDDCEGYVFTAAGGLFRAYDAESVVPAGEPLVIYTIEPGTKTLVFTTSTEETYAANDMNDLKGAATAMTAAEMAAANPTATKFYGLSLNAAGDANSVGFYYMVEGGAAFDAVAGKAYLALSGAAAPERILFNQNPVATGLENAAAVKATKALVNGNLVIIRNGQKFNLNGMLVK